MTERLRLTNIGRIAVTYGAMTGPRFYTDILREVNKVADEDGEWLLLLDERIAGLQSIREHARVDGLDWFKRIAEPPAVGVVQGDPQ